MKFKTLGLVLLLLFSFTFANTEVTFKCDTSQGTTIVDSTFEEDYIFLGKALDFSGETEDLISIGQKLDFRGKARLGILALGESIMVSGTAGNGVLAGGKEITIDGTINGTNFIGGKLVTIREGATIDGDLFVGANELVINDTIHGDIYAGANLVTINSVVKGNAKVYTGRLIMGEKGKIEGDLVYSAQEALSESINSKVNGVIIEDKNSCFKGDYSLPGETLNKIVQVIKIVLFLSFLISGLLILFFPIFKRVEPQLTPQQFWHTALWGLIPVFMYPALIAIFSVMVFPALLLLASFIPLFFMAIIVGTLKFGQQLSILFKWDVQKRHYHFLIGLLASTILGVIPIIDFLTLLLLVSLGWGVFVSLLFNKPLGGVPAKTDTPIENTPTVA